MESLKHEKINIGCSDISTLVLVGINEENNQLESRFIFFGEDGNYHAYLADENTEIPLYYNLIGKYRNWMKIYDDDGLTGNFKGDEINIYRCGNYGCIIQICNY